MSIIVPHRGTQAQRHAVIPFLWRATCSCGAYFLGPSKAIAEAGLVEHIELEEPFPDMDWAADPDSEAAKRERES